MWWCVLCVVSFRLEHPKYIAVWQFCQQLFYGHLSHEYALFSPLPCGGILLDVVYIIYYIYFVLH
nr:MAG TPA: hypothetical protein [Bacteriophage sp.]